jgi:hypothetical protein
VLASAPSALPRKIQFFLPSACLRSALSLMLFDSGQSLINQEKITGSTAGQSLLFQKQFATTGSSLILLVSGSAWRMLDRGPSFIGVDVLIDGSVVGAMNGFSNELNSVKALVPAFLTVDIAPGNHTLTLRSHVDTIVDEASRFSVAAIELD